MRLTIDTKACENNNLTIDEFLVLYLNAKNVDIQKTMDSIVEKDIAGRDLFNQNNLILSSKSRKLVDNVILESDKTVQNNAERIKELAQKLRDMYIPGKKLGTQDYFKCSSSEVEQKLKRFFAEYGEFTDEQIIGATQRYIDSFNGNYRFAQLLKYFISKKLDGEKGSRLLVYIENEDNNQVEDTQQEIDWDVMLK